MFDTNNDSFISLEEFIASMEDDDDHGDHHESHHNVALVYPDGTSAMVDVEHDSLPENATGWNLTSAAMTENNISVNSTYGTYGNYVSGIAGFEAPEDYSWWWELHTWNETSDAWEASTVGVDSVMIGDHSDHIAWAPNSTDDSTIPHPEEGHDEDDHGDHHESHHNVALVYPDGTSAMVDVEHDSLPENATGWNLTSAAMTENNISVNSTYGTYGNYVSGIAGFEAPEDYSWWWELHTWNETSDAWEASTVGVDSVMIGDHSDHIAWAPNSTDDSTIPHPEEGHDEDDHDDHEHELEMAVNNFLFSSADANSDGLLNTSDLETLLLVMEDAEDYLDADAMVSIYFDVFDEDENGLISIGEFTEMRGAMSGDEHDDHGDHNDDHGEESEMVCYDISTHTIDASYTTQADCEGAGLMWTAANSGPGHGDDDDHNETEMMEMMFTMFDTNEDGSLNESELHAMMDMGEDEHEEGVAFIGLHVEEEGDYGIALPAGVTMHVLAAPGGHDDHAGHDDHDDHDDRERDDHDDGDDHDDHEDRDEHDDHEDGDDHDDHANEEIAFDPHSWLDPVAFAAQVEVVYETLSTAFPDHADGFRANADAYKAELMAIDEGFTGAFGDSGTCTTNVVAANHNAYAYIAQRYDIEFVTLHGIDPEGEPSPEAIAEVLERVAEDGIKAIYVEEYSAEGALDSLIAQTVSDDLPDGLAVLTLNTMEIAPTDQTEDYLSLMNENLENLKTGLGC